MAIGTETSDDAYEYTRRVTLDVKRGWLREADFGRTKLNLAFFCGNLGELPDASAAIQHLRSHLSPDALVCVLDEPVVTPEVAHTPAQTRVAVFTPDSLKKLFCENKFSFKREEVTDGFGTFWFQAKSRR